MVDLYDDLLDEFHEARLCMRQQYMFKFRNERRVVYLDHTATYEDHLKRYNKGDIAVDSAPYSGTTTSCEAMLLGVPVITLVDRKQKRIHQNVTASLLINSGMAELVVENIADYKDAIRKLTAQIAADPNFKQKVQAKFLGGYVCNKKQYMSDYQELLASLHDKANT
jgi:predicted O-linked N-acetylglucosamine transferase (SPINDLY family)